MRIPRTIYKLKRHQRATVAILLFLVPLVALYSAGSALAAITYSITAQPIRIQEGQSTTLTLSVTGGATNTQYVFNITVLQPDGTTHSANNVQFTTDNTGAGSVNTNYPTGYASPTQGNTKFVGTYNIVVNQVTPIGAANPVATGSFTVGLTNNAIYQRTQTVLIQASGYGNAESVTVDINTNGGATHANGFPLVVTASASGLVSVMWHIPFNVATGTWTVTASGASTSKAPTDSQTITVNVATLLVTVTTDQSSYARTQTITAFATAQYPDGTFLNTTGAPQFGFVYVTFDNGSNFHVMQWNATAQNWYANGNVPGNIASGNLPQVWNVHVVASDNPGNTGSGSAYVTIRLIPSLPDLLVTVINDTGAFVPNTFLNLTYTNGTLVTSGTATTNATGQAVFTLGEGNSYTYWLVASHSGYNDHLNFINLQGNLMHVVIDLQSVTYSGSILSGGFTTKASYNPGDSGQLEVWVYNQNTTFTLTITKIEVRFPWYATYGNSYQGNTTVTGLPVTVAPKTNWNTTVSFTVPNDGRLYTGSGIATIYITANIAAWKTAWTISTTGNPTSAKILDTAYINPYTSAYYASRGFVGYGSGRISTPTQDTAAAGQLSIVEILAGISLLNVVFLALIWMRLKPQGIAAMPKA
jgi:hypothetical protein